MKKLTPFLWFDEDMREIVGFYRAVFEDAKLLSPLADSRPEHGAPEIVSMELLGIQVDMMSVAGKPGFTEGFSFVVNCADQAEVDHCWEALTADGGEESMCGWVKDRFGLSWQVVPTRLIELMSLSDAEAAARVTQAMLKMRKIIIADLEAAAG